MLSANGELGYEIASRISVPWVKRRSTTDVLCDRRINEYFRSKIYPSVICLYDFACWLTIKDNERRFSVMETKMWRWTASNWEYWRSIWGCILVSRLYPDQIFGRTKDAIDQDEPTPILSETKTEKIVSHHSDNILFILLDVPNYQYQYIKWN